MERFLQLTKETKSRRKKNNNKAVTVPKKEQTTKQFLLVHTCSHKVQDIFTAYQQDNFTTTDALKCTGSQALPKRSPKSTRSVPWTLLQPTFFFFSWRREMQNLGLRFTYFHNRRPHWGTDFSSCKLNDKQKWFKECDWQFPTLAIKVTNMPEVILIQDKLSPRQCKKHVNPNLHPRTTFSLPLQSPP